MLPEEFDRLTSDFLANRKEGSQSLRFAENTIKECRAYLIQNDCEFTSANILNFIKSFNTKNRSFYPKAMRLFYKILKGANLSDDCSILKIESRISQNFETPAWVENSIKEFIDSHNFPSSKTRRNIELRIRKFYYFAIQDGLLSLEKLDYFHVKNVYDKACHKYFLSSLTSYLDHVSAIANLPGLSHAYIYEYNKTLVRISDLDISKYSELSDTSYGLSEMIQVFDQIHNKFPKCLHEGYNAFKTRVELFCRANKIEFIYPILLAWVDYNSIFLKCFSRSYKRFIRVAYEVMANGSDICKSFCKEKETYPDWIAKHIDDYKKVRIENGVSQSTLNMDDNSIRRFISFAVKEGAAKLIDITPNLIKKFHINDINHKTSEAKNAYNIKIRLFLRHLEINELLPYGTADAMPHISATKRRPVEILTNEQLDILFRWFNTPTRSNTYYRDVALIKLMLFCGLRACDAGSLKFGEVDLLQRSINKIQQKTGEPITIPIFDSVINSIFDYLEFERSNSEKPYIFLNLKGDFCKTNTISNIVPRILGKNSGGSHILRRTFASNLLKSSACDAKLIAAILGHTGFDNVNKYLNTNDDLMSIVALEVEDFKYQGEQL